MSSLIKGSFETIAKSISTSTQLSSGLWLQTRDHPCLSSAKYVYRSFNNALCNFVHGYYVSWFSIFGHL